MKSLLVVFILLSSAFAEAETQADLHAIFLNRKAVKQLKDGQGEEALKTWAEALASSPDVPEVHLNMGLAFEATGQNEKALQSYQTADHLANSPGVQFMARFNQGALLQKAKKTDQALDAYHAALDVNPASRETKINIELLIQEQQGQGQGQGEQEQKDKSDKDQDQKQDQQKDGKDQKDQKDQQGQGEQKKDDKPKEYSKNKPQPKPFKSEDLTQSDVNKILGELRNQEQRIRSDYNKREVKEQSREKDW